ncbi:MAG: TSUP family transporter [Clostridia bacterium]|nr:TSUP family transporter [Clostridia bacterium]
MSFYLYLVLGILGGVPAGMGMGGGTVTIPLLTLVGGVGQKIAQSANLFSFLPMSAPALRIHAQNGLLKTEGILWIILPAFLVGAAGTFFAAALPSETLGKLFGAFLIGLSFLTFYQSFAAQKG